MYNSFMEIEKELLSSGVKKTVALANAQDREALSALVYAKRRGIVTGKLIGDKAAITELLQELGENPAEYDIIECNGEMEAALLAVKMVHGGYADIPMKGIMQTANFMRAVLNKEFGFVASGSLLSQATVLEWKEKNRLLIFGDCAINIAPNLEDKVKIIRNMVELAHCLGIARPKVAVISAVEGLNDKIPSTVDSAALVAMKWEDCVVAGPFALDNAVSEEAAKHKGITAPVAGKADILLMPDLCTGNVFTKSLTFFAHLESAGVVCGPQIPVIMTSRTDTPANKYHSILTAVTQSLR